MEHKGTGDELKVETLTTTEGDALKRWNGFSVLPQPNGAYVLYTDHAAEVSEQCRLNAMGAEREAKLMARVAELESDLKVRTLQRERSGITIHDLRAQLEAAVCRGCDRPLTDSELRDAAGLSGEAQLTAQPDGVRERRLELALAEIEGRSNVTTGGHSTLTQRLERIHGIASQALTTPASSTPPEGRVANGCACLEFGDSHHPDCPTHNGPAHYLGADPSPKEGNWLAEEWKKAYLYSRKQFADETLRAYKLHAALEAVSKSDYDDSVGIIIREALAAPAPFKWMVSSFNGTLTEAHAVALKDVEAAARKHFVNGPFASPAAPAPAPVCSICGGTKDAPNEVYTDPIEPWKEVCVHPFHKKAPAPALCPECGHKPGTWEGCGTCDEGRGLEASDLLDAPAPACKNPACMDGQIELACMQVHDDSEKCIRRHFKPCPDCNAGEGK